MMRWVLFFGGLCLATACFSQEIRFTDSCWTLLQKAGLANDLGDYEYALRIYDSSLRGCKSKLVLTGANTGKSRALTGLKRYTEAIAAADAAISLANNASVAALFERADASFAAGLDSAGSQDYTNLERRLQKSTKPREKAFILSKLSLLDWRQENKQQAFKQLNYAISLDPGNALHFLQLGDFYVLENKFAEAIQNFEKAGTNEANQLLVAWKKASAYTLAIRRKYRLHDAKELKFKLRTDEKLAFCEYWKTAFNAGYSNKQDALNFNFICQ